MNYIDPTGETVAITVPVIGIVVGVCIRFPQACGAIGGAALGWLIPPWPFAIPPDEAANDNGCPPIDNDFCEKQQERLVRFKVLIEIRAGATADMTDQKIRYNEEAREHNRFCLKQYHVHLFWFAV